MEELELRLTHYSSVSSALSGNVVILAEGNGESTTEIETPGGGADSCGCCPAWGSSAPVAGPTLLQEKAWDGWAGGSERVLCDAASAVTTEQFVPLVCPP